MRSGGRWLDDGARLRLEERLRAALRRARSRGEEVLAAVTVAVDPGVDPTAVVCAARRAGEPWFCMEQPERVDAALAALGAVVELRARGPERFATVAAGWRALVAGALGDPPDGPPGTGLVALGGFAFDPEGGASEEWSAYPAASLVVPEVAIARSRDDVRLTVAARVRADDAVEELIARLEGRLAELDAGARVPLLDPAPATAPRVSSALAPVHYEEAVARATQRIAAGELEKVVLAREVNVHAGTPHDPAAVAGVLREVFGGCFVFCVGRGKHAFLGATPELLIRREGQRASTMALAGTTGRSADPAVDDHLGERMLRADKLRSEHDIVVRRIVRGLRRRAVWVSAAPEPTVARMANVQHLATPIRAQLSEPVGAVELAGELHPTPAVGGEPAAVAARLIPALEGMDRGWYAGPVGWTDAGEDGEFCVALRCALLHGRHAHCYAGNGIVRDSDPAAELAETEIKLQAMLPVLAP
jgi:salicylate biosynthesis isochorismate synthase/menaquinone-specific isochorismate synthase